MSKPAAAATLIDGVMKASRVACILNCLKKWKCLINYLIKISDNFSIADKFASMFKSTCVPNSNVRHESLKANFQQKFDRYP